MTNTRNLALTAIGVAILILAPLSLAAAADDRIDKIKDSGVIRICQVDYPPMNIKDPVSGKWTGVLPEMSEAFAAELGAKPSTLTQRGGPSFKTSRPTSVTYRRPPHS